MLRPSYSDLLEVVSKEKEDSFETGSRYTIVIAAAKRAREIVDRKPILTENGDPDKPVSTAVKELYEGKIKITYIEDMEEEVSPEEEIDYESISVVSDDIFKKADFTDEFEDEFEDEFDEEEDFEE